MILFAVCVAVPVFLVGYCVGAYRERGAADRQAHRRNWDHGA